VLDDALIPAQGAPVQCTRCGLVFTAKPPTRLGVPGQPSGTHLFGNSPAPKPAASANTTQMFGGAAAQAPQANSTALFGALNQPKPNQTLMFGAAGPKAAPAANPQASTALFGALGSGPTASPRSTQVFGALGQAPIAPAPPPAEASKGPITEPVVARPTPSPSSTMMFGVAKEPMPAAPAPAPSPSSTMMFGAVKEPVVAAPAPAAAPSPSSTMMFGAVKDPIPPAPKPSNTMMFGVASGSPAPAWQAPPPDASFSPQAPPVQHEAPVPLTQPKRQVTGPMPLPGAPMPFPARLGESAEPDLSDDPFARKLASRNRRAGTTAFVLVLLAAAGGGAWWYQGRPKPPPPELVARASTAFRSVELDTVASLQSARVELEKLAAVSPPNFVAVPKSDALVVLAFQAADLRDQVTTLERQRQALDKAYKKADADHSRADWRTVLENIRKEEDQLRQRHDPLVEQAAKLDTQESDLLKQLGDLRGTLNPIPAELDRAIGVYYGFKGSESAARFAKSYRSGGQADGWAELIAAASADQSRQTAETYQAGLSAAQAALKANPRLTRAKRIAADLQLALHQFEAARATANELALELPDDPRVKLLLGNIDAEEKAQRPTGP